MKKLWTASTVREAKGKAKLAMLTAYDFQMASLLDQAGVDLLLVGDSLGNVIYGARDTLSVTMDDMTKHTKAVSSAVKRAMVVADMPFLSYQLSREEALRNAGRLIAEGGADAVKLEGGGRMADVARAIVELGIPVMGHVGLTPQSYLQLGGYKRQGKTESEATRIVGEAKELEKAGAFSIVLECIPEALAKRITNEIGIPTIGIGSGAHVDGQVLVINDLLGLTAYQPPSFVVPKANLAAVIQGAVGEFLADVRA